MPERQGFYCKQHDTEHQNEPQNDFAPPQARAYWRGGLQKPAETRRRPRAGVYHHGYGATVADHWFPWLAQQLRGRGMEVVQVPLPDSLHPDYGRWQDALARTVGMPSGRTVLVAHSLGTVSLLHYLSRIRPHKVGGLVLVSAFGARIPDAAAD